MDDKISHPHDRPVSHVPPASRSMHITITPRTLWLAAALVVALLAGYVLVSQALSALVLVFIALILAEGLRPPVNWLNRRAHVPRPLGVLLIYVCLIVVFAGLVALLLSPVVAQVNTLSRHVPEYVAQLQALVNQLLTTFNGNDLFGKIANQLASALQNVVPALVSLPLTAVSNAISLVFSVVVVLTLVIFWLSTTDDLKPFILGLFPMRARDEVAGIIAELSRGLGGYVRGTLVNMFAIGIFTGLGLFILGVPYALLLGILAGMTELIPYLGPWISGSVATVVALIAVDPLKAVEVIIFFLIVQQLEGNTLQPLVMSRAVHENPFVVLVAITIGVELMGVLGAILAVPAAAVVQILVLRVLAPAARRASRRGQETATSHEVRAVVAPATSTAHEAPS